MAFLAARFFDRRRDFSAQCLYFAPERQGTVRFGGIAPGVWVRRRKCGGASRVPSRGEFIH